MSKIGVFDSGVGGLSVANAVQSALPEDTVIFVNDEKHVPYGDKSPQEVLGYVVPILQNLADRGCDIIVIACNTVTTHHINKLRQIINVPLIGIEPMVKPAAKLTKSGVIAVCATPATLSSARYAWLKQNFAQNVEVLEPDCSQWASMIESNHVNVQYIRKQIDGLCDANADVIVLGCTHYHWIKDLIQEMAEGRAVVIQPEQSVVRRVKELLSEIKDR